MTIERTDMLDIIEGSITRRLAMVHTCMPAYIVKQYDGQKVDVQPVIRGKRLNDDKEIVSYQIPQITSVPLAWPQAGGLALTFPLKTSSDDGIDNADWVLLVFAERSIDEWMAYGAKDTDSQSKRRYHLSDAIAYAGLRPSNDLLEDVPQDRLRLGQHLSSNPVRIEVTQDTGKVRIGNDNAELLKMLDDFLGYVEDSGCITSLGNQPLQADILSSPTPIKPLIQAIRTKLAEILEP